MSALARGRDPHIPDPTSPLTATGNLRRREFVSRLVDGLSVLSALIAVAVLVLVVVSVIQYGASAIGIDFVTKNTPRSNVGGGVASALIGSTIIVAAATVIAAPVGILTALYLTEIADRRARTTKAITLALNVMQGLPTIVVGVVVYGLIVLPMGHQSGFAGSVALSIVMVPLIARSSQEVLHQVPGILREAGDALGVNRWRTIIKVVVPAAAGGMLTGTILAVARAAGETAPVFVTDFLFDPSQTSFNLFQPMPNIPVMIFELVEQPVPGGFERAWGAALFLMTIILIANVGARVMLARSRRKMGL
jgi:phosphate transport system permease protein